MPNHSASKLNGVLAKDSRARFASAERAGEQDANAIGTEKRLLGSVTGRALQCAGLTPKEAAHRLGYSESSSVSDFVSGLTAPAFLSRFVADPVLRGAFIEALAELPDDGVTVEKVVHISRKVRTA